MGSWFIIPHKWWQVLFVGNTYCICPLQNNILFASLFFLYASKVITTVMMMMIINGCTIILKYENKLFTAITTLFHKLISICWNFLILFKQYQAKDLRLLHEFALCDHVACSTANTHAFLYGFSHMKWMFVTVHKLNELKICGVMHIKRILWYKLSSELLFM
jgi:hypothetical protein